MEDSVSDSNSDPDNGKESENSTPLEMGTCRGFQTASGKFVAVSEEALKNAKALFADIAEITNLSHGADSSTARQQRGSPVPHSGTASHCKSCRTGYCRCVPTVAASDRCLSPPPKRKRMPKFVPPFRPNMPQVSSQMSVSVSVPQTVISACTTKDSETTGSSKRARSQEQEVLDCIAAFLADDDFE